MDTVRLETRFGMADGLTPVLAARIAECASRYDSHVSIESAGRAIRIESLISVLSMELRRGLPLTVIAEGEDANEAAASLCALLAGAGAGSAG